MTGEVVRVKREGGRGHHLINKHEFDPKVHELFDDQKGKPKTEPKQKTDK